MRCCAADANPAFKKAVSARVSSPLKNNNQEKTKTGGEDITQEAILETPDLQAAANMFLGQNRVMPSRHPVFYPLSGIAL